jgi:hypothetical protein
MRRQYVTHELLAELADEAGFVLLPQFYDMQFTAAATLNTQRVTPDAGDGPFIVVGLHEVATIGGGTKEVSIRSGARDITQGSVLWSTLQALSWSPDTPSAQHILSQPIFLARNETLEVTFSGPAIVADNALLIEGYHLRRKGSLERVGADGDAFVHRLRRSMGELFAVGITTPAAGGQVQTVLPHDAEWRGVGFSASGSPTHISARVAGVELFPRGLPSVAADTNIATPRRSLLGQLATKKGAVVEYRLGGDTGNLTLVGLALRG